MAIPPAPKLLALSLIALSSVASFAQATTGACTLSFSVVTLDRLNNYDYGVPVSSLKDIEKRVSKYPGICYVANSKGDVIFFIHTTPAVYHGTRVYTNNSSSAAAATDGNGGAAAAAASSTSTTAVPYDVDYSVFMLDIEVPQADGTFKVIRTFDQKGLYRTIYGIGYGKGKHPIPNVIEAATSWLRESAARVQNEIAAAAASPPPAPVPTAVPVHQSAVTFAQAVSVDANVPNCDIEVDGEFVGNTPSTVSLAPGKHQIVVKKAGFQDWSRSMTVGGGNVRLNAEMLVK
jgi:hypothetical protein